VTQVVRIGPGRVGERLIDVQRVGDRVLCLRCAPPVCEGVETASKGFLCEGCGERYAGSGHWEVEVNGQWRRSTRGVSAFEEPRGDQP
jgi:hypothetical protein